MIGVKEHVGIPNAIIASTSEFTAGARQLCESRHDLHLVDERRLQEWLLRYEPLSAASYAAERSFSSCFISYSSTDEDFAQKLASRLRREGVAVWFASEDILPGRKIYDQVKKAIASFDRLLVVLSPNSMRSQWVKTELASALAREKREGRQVLFPIAIAKLEAIKQWECFDADSGLDIAREIRAYHIPDFSDWTSAAVFEKQVRKVLLSLSAAEQSVSGRETDPRIGEIINLLHELKSQPPVILPKGSRIVGELWPHDSDDLERIQRARALLGRATTLLPSVPPQLWDEISEALVRFEQRIQLYEYGEFPQVGLDKEFDRVSELVQRLERDAAGFG